MVRYRLAIMVRNHTNGHMGGLESKNELERELGKEKALEIVGRACDRMAVESTA